MEQKIALKPRVYNKVSIHGKISYPDGFLLKPTLPVENIDGNLQKFIDDMADTMFDAPGVGLAAIQVGSNQSLLIYDDAPGEAKQSYNAIINPQLVDSHGEILSENEGCLSGPQRCWSRAMTVTASRCRSKPTDFWPLFCSMRSII